MRNLAHLQKMEAHRRLKLLGTTREDASGAGLRARASLVGIPVAVLYQWHASYLHHGFDALLPSWSDISESTWILIIFDRIGCPIVIVGLPHIMSVILRHEKFVSRVGLQMEFLPLAQEEVLTTVLPALTLPYWQYQADESADREMGTLLWQRVCPSLRKLRVVLQYASQIAATRQAKRITSEILTETFRLTLIPRIPAPRSVTSTEERGSYEAASEQKPPHS